MTLQASAQNQLRQYIKQIERLEEEKSASAADIRDKYAEAKAIGFDPKAMRKLVALRRKSKTERQEEDAILETYMHALGMLDGTPMGDYLARDDGDVQTTISINGGPEHPISVVKAAVDIVRSSRAKA